MNKKTLLSLLLVAAISGCGSTATDTADATATNETSEQKGEVVAKADDIVCTYEEKTGTRFKKKVCLPRAVRDKLRAEAQETMRNQSRSFQRGN